MILSQNLEIHKVFLRFFAFILTKKSSQSALADFIVVYPFYHSAPFFFNQIRIFRLNQRRNDDKIGR